MAAGGGPRDAERHGLARRRAEGTRAAGPSRHGDGEGVRTDRQGRELGGHLPGAELGPLGRAASPALGARETPCLAAPPSRPRSGLALAPTHSSMHFSAVCVLSRAPTPTSTLTLAQPPFVPTGPHPRCFLVWTGPPQALFLCLPGREVSSPTPPTPRTFPLLWPRWAVVEAPG